MSEGLLKKRMATEFRQFNKEEVDFLLKPFYLVIDEADEAFPDFDFVELVNSAQKIGGIPIAVMVDLNKIRELFEWKKRWFGWTEKDE